MLSWFFPALICVLGWGCADLFYKRGADEDDPRSALKTAVWVGLVMGVCALAAIPFSETVRYADSAGAFFRVLLAYSPASLCYILSMVIGYAGLRYLELSIVSPVQNASGALSAVLMLSFFLISGRIGSIKDEYSLADLVGTLLIVTGVSALAIVEKHANKKEPPAEIGENKYRFGALALMFPLLYCVFDTLGTAADGILLDEETGLGIGEMDVVVLYGLTFFLAGVAAWVYLLIRDRRPYCPFARTERDRAVAAVCEEFGQIFYIFAMAKNPVLAAPAVASYCVVSMILSRVFLGEKLRRDQYLCVFATVAGIVILGISEGLGAA